MTETRLKTLKNVTR